jgi:FtsP/CotA-like multicopper oxidase with cupredoxin domain
LKRLEQEMSEMKALAKQIGRVLSVSILLLVLPATQAMAEHEIRGITGPDFDLYAFPFHMNLPDGSSMYMWGFGDRDGGTGATHPEGAGYNLPQYPAPTLIVNQGDTVNISLTNHGISQPVSIVVAGHNVSATGGVAGLVTQSAVVGGGMVTYTFTASNPGTYVYHSLDGPNPGLQAEMGLQGVLIVRPADAGTAYGAATYTDYDQEYLFLLTEIDPDVHLLMEKGNDAQFTHADRHAEIWFVNGRVFPDLVQGDYNSLYPHQPYQALAQAHPGDAVLVREVNAGHDSHPFHHHGENLRFIARDGRMLDSGGGVADLGRSDNTLNSAPKQAVDMIWTWTGKGLNWDIYGTGADYEHECNSVPVTVADPNALPAGPEFDATTYEYCADHGKELPVTLPGVQDLSLGGWWSGSPFLGDSGDLPPGEGGLNPFGGYYFAWHSHLEKELTTFDVFPGGSLSLVVILPSGLAID